MYIRSAMNNPFRYTPSREMKEAAEELISKIKASENLHESFSTGKMLGILIAEGPEGERHSFAAFSGLMNGCNKVDGFVPPIFDYLDPNGHFKKGEAMISHAVKVIEEGEYKDFLSRKQNYMTLCEEHWNSILQTERVNIELCRRIRNKIALEKESSAQDSAPADNGFGMSDEEAIERLKFHKAELHRMKKNFAAERLKAEKIFAEEEAIFKASREKCKLASAGLQNWLFGQYRVKNALGQELSVLDIFSREGKVPPGGTGECAAPKLLQYAYTHGLKPIEVGEFWYGAPSEGRIRKHGHFYPSCTEKCAPLLGFMLEGLQIEEDKGSGTCQGYSLDTEPKVVFQDDTFVVAVKPSGLPSVPGKDGRGSLQQWLAQKIGRPVLAVHRLDMDTSGLMMFALTEKAQSELMRQFEKGEVRKIYRARIEYNETIESLPPRGQISLPLAGDYAERPRQRVDSCEGKEALTEYEILSVSPQGVDVRFHPLTGRTHQLRIHSAHPKGLDSPIMGDRLYGSADTAPRLCLHAERLEFTHPMTGEKMIFEDL